MPICPAWWMTQWKPALKKRFVILQSVQLNRNKFLTLKATASKAAQLKAALYTRGTTLTCFEEKQQLTFYPFFSNFNTINKKLSHGIRL